MIGDEYDDLLDSFSTPKPKGAKTRPAVDFRKLYNDVGQKYGVDPDLLYNQAKHESVNFNPHFVFGPGRSPKGAAGLAQFMPDTARQYGLRVMKGQDDRFNPQKAADAHARLMKDLLDKYGDTRLALAAYNAGTGFTPDQARRAMQRIPETRNYVQKIAPKGDAYDDLLDSVSSGGDEYDQLLNSVSVPRGTSKGRGAGMANAQQAPRRQLRGAQVQPDAAEIAKQIGGAVTAQAQVGSPAAKMRQAVRAAAPPGFSLLPESAQELIGGTIGQAAGGLATQAAGVGKSRLLVSPAVSATEYLASKVGVSPAKTLGQAGQTLQAGVQQADIQANRPKYKVPVLGDVSPTEAARDIVAGSISSSPAMILTAFGVPAPIAFGLQSNLEAEGRDEDFKHVVLETAKGATIGKLFELSPFEKAGLAKRIAGRVGTVGAGTFAVEAGTGTPIPSAASSAIVNALFAATGAGKRRASETPTEASPRMAEVPAEASRGVEAPAAEVAAPKQWQHRDFGLVTESDNQSGTGKGRVRVTAEDGSTHVIQHADLRGAGNQIAIPVKTQRELPPEAVEGIQRAREDVRRAIEERNQPEPSPAERPIQPLSTPEVPEPATAVSPRESAIEGAQPVQAETTPLIPEAEIKAEIADSLRRKNERVAAGEGAVPFNQRPRNEIGLNDIQQAEWDKVINNPENYGGVEGVKAIVEKSRLSREQKDALISRIAAPPIEEAKPPAPQEIPEPQKGVPVKTAAIEAERAEAGLNPIEKQQYRNIGESFLRGKQAVEKNEIDPRKLAAEVAQTERPLTADETGALGYDRTRLRNDYDAKIKEVSEAVDKGDAQAIASRRAELEEIERLADVNDAALEKGGREQSIAFNARKMIVGRDYSLLGIIQRAKAAKGEQLTPQERGRFETLEKQLAEAEKKIAVYESAKPDRSIRRLISDVERQARREKRSATKAELDTEFAALKQQFAQARAEVRGVQPSGLAGIDPEGKLTKLVAQMARNRVLAGFNTVEGLVDELHFHLKDYVDDKRAIRDLFSGYGKEPAVRTKDEITTELNRLKQEARKLSKVEDRNPVTEAAKQEASRQKAVKTRLTKQIVELERQLREKDYAKPPKREPITYDREAEQLLAHRDLLKDRIEREIAKQKKPLWEDYLTWWQQGTILSGTRTLAKLGSYALGKNVIIPIEDVISGGMSHVPGLKGLSEASPRYGGGVRENVKAQAAAFNEFVHKAMYRDAWESLKEGTNALKLKHEKSKYQYTPRLLTFIRGLHMAEKVFASRPEYYRAIEKETQWALRNGLNPQDPKVQSQILSRSYMNGLRAQLMQPNVPSKILSTTNAWLESVGRTGKVGQIQEPGVGIAARGIRTAIRTLFPITRVPFNYVNESLSYNPVGGFAKGGGRMGIEAYKTLRAKGFGKGVTELFQQGMRNMPPEAADATKRALVKGTLGIPLFLIGWYNYQNIGGYYQPGQRKEGDVPFGGMRIGGHDIPRALVHNPIFEVMHFAATMRRVYEGEKEGGDLTHAVGSAVSGATEEVPFVDVPQRIGKAYEHKAGFRNLAGEIARSATIPPDVQRIAAMSDTAVPTTKTQKALQVLGLKDVQAIKRKPEGFAQTYMMGVPGLRQKVPINETAEKRRIKYQAIDDYRSGKITKDDLNAKVESGEMTKAEVQAITKQGEMTPRQAAFSNARPMDALERYTRMNDAQKAEVQSIMERHAWTLTHSDALTQAEKDKYQERLDALGITPVNSQTRKASSPFSRRFLSAP